MRWNTILWEKRFEFCERSNLLAWGAGRDIHGLSFFFGPFWKIISLVCFCVSGFDGLLGRDACSAHEKSELVREADGPYYG